MFLSTIPNERQGFRENNTEHRMCVLIFSTIFILNVSHLTKNSARYFHKYTYVLMWSTPIIIRFWRTFNFLDRFSSKKKSIEFHENPSSGTLVVPRGRTDMTKLRVAFRNFANAPNKTCRLTVDVPSTSVCPSWALNSVTTLKPSAPYENRTCRLMLTSWRTSVRKVRVQNQDLGMSARLAMT